MNCLQKMIILNLRSGQFTYYSNIISSKYDQKWYYKEKYHCLVSGATGQRVQTPPEDRGSGPS